MDKIGKSRHLSSTPKMLKRDLNTNGLFRKRKRDIQLITRFLTLVSIEISRLLLKIWKNLKKFTEFGLYQKRKMSNLMLKLTLSINITTEN